MKRRRFLQSSIAAATALPLTLLSNPALAGVLNQMSEVKGEVRAVKGDGSEISIERAAVEELSSALRGRLLLPGQSGYDKARHVLNADIDRFPALIVQPSGDADIRLAVTFTRERELLLAVKCGGHSWSGKSTCQDGMQIDLTSYRNVTVDPTRKKAWAAGGSLLGELDHEAMSHGLVTTAGTVSHTGIGGLTLGGGFGRVARRFGLALDNVTGFQLVTADGQLRRANAEENPGLYWGLRGGGGNFGVVTIFEFDLHPMQRQVIAGAVIYPLSQARDVIMHYGESLANAPDELYLDFRMDSQLGSTDGTCMIYGCYSGPAEMADNVLKPIYSFGSPIQISFQANDYVAEQRSWDNTDPRSNGEYLKSGFVQEIGEGLAQAIAEGFEPTVNRSNVVFFQCGGGKINRVAADATAFAHRFAQASVFTTASWPKGDDRSSHVRYVKQAWAGMEPHTRGFYTNEVADESPEAVNKNYEGNYARLVQLKNQYDPGNLFRLNANVQPTV